MSPASTAGSHIIPPHTHSGEGAKHRRERRRRSDARAIVRVANGAQLLASHHSCSMPQRNGPQQRQRQQKQHGQDDRGRELLPGPRSPHWGCSACGEDANWACRLFCKGCKRSAPQSVINKAKAAAKQQAASGSGPRTPPCPTKSSRPTKEQLEHEALKVENLALRQSRDHYKSKVAEQAAARAGLAAAVDGNQPASQADDESMEQSEDIRAQIKVQRAKVKALERAEEVV